MLISKRKPFLYCYEFINVFGHHFFEHSENSVSVIHKTIKGNKIILAMFLWPKFLRSEGAK